MKISGSPKLQLKICETLQAAWRFYRTDTRIYKSDKPQSSQAVSLVFFGVWAAVWCVQEV